MGMHGSSTHLPVGLPGRNNMRGGTHSPYPSKGGSHYILPSATKVGTRTNVQGTRWPNHRIATSCPHPRRGPTWHLGWHLPKIHTYIISSLQEMQRAHDPYIPTALTAGPIVMHRPSHHMGSSTHSPPGGGCTDNALGIPGPPRGPRPATPPDFNRGRYSPSEHTATKSVYLPIPNPRTLPRGMEIPGGSGITFRHHTREGHDPLAPGISRIPYGEIFPEEHREISQDATANILDLTAHLQSIPGGRWTRQRKCSFAALRELPHGAPSLAISGTTQCDTMSPTFDGEPRPYDT